MEPKEGKDNRRSQRKKKTAMAKTSAMLSTIVSKKPCGMRTLSIEIKGPMAKLSNKEQLTYLQMPLFYSCFQGVDLLLQIRVCLFETIDFRSTADEDRTHQVRWGYPDQHTS